MPDLEQPWEIKNHVTKWMDVLKDAIFQMTPNIDYKKLEFLRSR
jgi:hypothetical protein